MGKKTKLREAQKLAAEQAIAARLRERAAAKPRRAFIESFLDFSSDYRERIEKFRAFAVRAPEGWRCAVRSRAPERRFLDLMRFTFGIYPAPAHLENAWLGADAFPVRAAADEEEEKILGRGNFRSWYITVAQGGSLYGFATGRFMSRVETHHFLKAPDVIGETQRAFWYAFARAQTDEATAVLVARTKLVRFPVDSTFWQDAARFFARNPTGVLAMNDLIDFLEAVHQADPDFSLANRTLPALIERMHEWHRALRSTADGLCWVGAALPDVTYDAVFEGKPAIWRFRQIVNDYALVEEGTRMSHCVATYRYDCAMGATSIWALTCETQDGEIQSRVTIELTRDGRIAQCRGPHNCAPGVGETAIIKRWAADFGLILEAYELEAAQNLAA
jgi:hypothetical protein